MQVEACGAADAAAGGGGGAVQAGLGMLREAIALAQAEVRRLEGAQAGQRRQAQRKRTCVGERAQDGARRSGGLLARLRASRAGAGRPQAAHSAWRDGECAQAQ